MHLQHTNKLDLLIVLVSLVLVLIPSDDLQVLKGLRILRALKPLRALSKSDGMRLVFKSLTLSMAAMGNLSLICVLFFLIFAILGVQVFAGKFYSCNDTSVPNKAACQGEYRPRLRGTEAILPAHIRFTRSSFVRGSQ